VAQGLTEADRRTIEKGCLVLASLFETNVLNSRLMSRFFFLRWPAECGQCLIKITRLCVSEDPWAEELAKTISRGTNSTIRQLEDDRIPCPSMSPRQNGSRSVSTVRVVAIQTMTKFLELAGMVQAQMVVTGGTRTPRFIAVPEASNHDDRLQAGRAPPPRMPPRCGYPQLGQGRREFRIFVSSLLSATEGASPRGPAREFE